MKDQVPSYARTPRVRTELRVNKRLHIRGPRIKGEHEFEAFIEFANRVKMDDTEFRMLKNFVQKKMPIKPLYVCTIKKSNKVEGKAKMYFSKSFTMHHILSNVELPAEIQVFSPQNKVATVKMVMSKSKVKGKGKGGAMITTNWIEVVKQNAMRVNDIYIFWFRQTQDGGLKILVDKLN